MRNPLPAVALSGWDKGSKPNKVWMAKINIEKVHPKKSFEIRKGKKGSCEVTRNWPFKKKKLVEWPWKK